MGPILSFNVNNVLGSIVKAGYNTNLISLQFSDHGRVDPPFYMLVAQLDRAVAF